MAGVDARLVAWRRKRSSVGRKSAAPSAAWVIFNIANLIQHSAESTALFRPTALIAAHAVALRVTVVTNNVDDFKVYPGIKIENWVEAN